MKAPNRLDFSPEEIDDLINRLNHKCLKEEDYPLLTDILMAMIWLSFSLKEKELSIKRLRKIFGIKTESAKKLLQLAKGGSSGKGNKGNEELGNEDLSSETKEKEEEIESEDSTFESTEDNEGLGGEDSLPTTEENANAENKDSEDKPKGHGHRPSTDYSEAEMIEIVHQALRKGDTCPHCLKGKLFHLKPGIVIRIVGQPWLKVEVYRPEKFRCSLCGNVFTAKLPTEVVTGSRADISAKAIVTLLKYRGGVPFYRQEQIQEILGAPISASEIWEMTEDVADAVQPIYAALCKEAASADLVHNDDTTAKILSRMKEIKASEKESERTGTFTSCIIAVLKGVGAKIGLFFTGKKHAGENLDDLLKNRQGLSPPIQECDALSRNVPKNHDTQVANCLAHLRRKFYELFDIWPQEVTDIIGKFEQIFANDHSAPTDPEERLKWHQELSTSIMNAIKSYCNNLIEKRLVEPNSSMGKAIAYLNNHWKAFTLFLRIPGVPLTNNAAERMIKRAVLNRKNAYFFRNETGSKIADILMSTMETCVLNDVNPHNFLIAIQQYRDDVFRNPTLWFPWLYEKRVKELCPE